MVQSHSRHELMATCWTSAEPSLAVLLRSLGSGADLHLETKRHPAAGPVARSSFDQISVSPKLANAGSRKPTQHTTSTRTGRAW